MTDCILWTGALDRYGYPKKYGRRVYRDLWVEAFGPVPEGLVLDHQCHNEDLTCPGGVTCLHRRCVNLAHLVTATWKENALRGRSPAAQNALKTHCSAGHAFDEANTYRHQGHRTCRTCNRAAVARYDLRMRVPS